MEMFLVPFLGICALFGASAASSCLDPTDIASYSCEVSSSGYLSLNACDITDEDVDGGDLASCLDNAGRELVAWLSLGLNDLTTLPAGIFEGLTALEQLNLDFNGLTTLPAGIFEGLTALEILYLDSNALTTLPAGIFEGLTALEQLYLYDNALTTLPAGIFEGLTNMSSLYLYDNALTTLPAGIFEGLTALYRLSLSDNALTTLPAGIFEGLTGLEYLDLDYNALTTLPAGIFEGLTALYRLTLGGNDLECLPTIPSTLLEVDDDSSFADGLHVDVYGEECGCSAANVTDVCGEETCTPGPVGYTCDDASDTTPMIAGVISAVAGAVLIGLGLWLRRRRNGQKTRETSQPRPTISRDFESDPGFESPTGFGTTVLLHDGGHPTHLPDAQTEADAMASNGEGFVLRSDTTAAEPVIASAEPAASAVDGAAALVVGNSDKKPAPHENYVSPHQDTPVEDNEGFGGGIVPPSAPASLDRQGEAHAADGGVRGESPSHEDTSPHTHTMAAPSALLGAAAVAEDDGAGLAAENKATGGSLPAPTAPPAEDSSVVGLAGEEDAAGGSVKKSLETVTSIATLSTANMSTAEQEDVAQFRQKQRAADAAPVFGEAPVGGADGIGASSSSASRQISGSDIGLGQAVLAAAQELARSCQIPGVSEAAGAVCIMANLFLDSRDNDQASKSRLRQCRSMVLALKRADKVVGKGGDTMGEAARVLIEDVQDAIFDLVELIKTFQSKNKLSKLFLSTLFKRRQDELDAVVNQAIMRLQLGLQLQAGHDMSSIKDSMKSMEDGMKSTEEGMHLSRQGSTAEATSESVAEARRIRRQRKLDQVEISDEHLFITDDLLGKGGFGEVYLADYNGHNAAAKVLHIGQDLGALDENQKQRETRQRRAFLRELEAMIRLRSPNTVNVFGAVTCLPDRMVLVMELLPNGDLLALLKKSKKPLPEKQARRIIRDICAGMAFLHSKNTVHGDLKSANVLLDGDDRAKIADFGTSRWTQSTNTTGLATYTTKSNQNTQMSIAWSAPEVLEAEGSSYESDVYSFGIVTWEVTTRELPWANKTRPRDILTAVLRGDRPSFHVDTPADIVNIAKACWCAEPKERTTFSAILEGMKAEEWRDE